MPTPHRPRSSSRSPRGFIAFVLAIVVLILGVVAWRSGVFGELGRRAAAGPTDLFPDDGGPPTSASPSPSPTFATGPINPEFPGLTTWRGNLTRSYYGEGPVPQNPVIRWRFPASGDICGVSDFGTGSETRCGFAWTGQPNIIPAEGGGYELRIGAYDHNYHFLDAFTGEAIRGDVVTGDVAKGSATSDPDGYPLYYGGSRDNLLRVVALDRGQTPEVLWTLDANSSVSNPVWNDDWDGAPLIVGDYLLEGGENSWFYVIRLNRGYGDDGLVTVNPKVVAAVPGYDADLLASLDNDDVSIESSVAFFGGVAYFVNSGGLVQGWDISQILKGGTNPPERVFRFWNGDDSDGTIAIDEDGFLYVPKHNEHDTQRNHEVGDIIKLDPSKPDDPLVWSVDVSYGSTQHEGGIWSSPALHGNFVYVTTTYGEVIAINRTTGVVRWKMKLNDSHTWGSPLVVDDTLIVGDCSGVLHAWDVSEAKKPPELWSLSLDGTCIEATPAVYDGWIWAGTRGGALYGISDPA